MEMRLYDILLITFGIIFPILSHVYGPFHRDSFMKCSPPSCVVYPVPKSRNQESSVVLKMVMQLNHHSKLKMESCTHLRKASSFYPSLLP